MKEDELIRKLETVELPDIEVTGHRCRLRTALLESGCFTKQQEATTMAMVKARTAGVLGGIWGRLVTPRPAWQLGLGGVVVAAVVITVSLMTSLPGGQTSHALAADIARTDPAVLAALESGAVSMVEITEVVGDIATIRVRGLTGDELSVKVDIDTKEVTAVTIVFSGPRLSAENEELARSVARADPRVQAILDQGAGITMVLPVFVTVERIDPKAAQEHSVIAQVWMTLGGRQWYAYVNLEQERVTDVIED